MKVNKNKIILALIFVVIIISGLSYYIWAQENRNQITEVHILNLKGGVALFVRTPNDKRYVINGGSNSEIVRHITKILPFYSRYIDGVFVTDTNPNNAGGLISIVDRYDVKSAYLPIETIYTLGLASSTNDAYKVLVDRIGENGLEIKKISAGNEVILDDTANVKAQILFPAEKNNDITFEYSKSSPPQVIMRIADNNGSIIILGNSTKKIQKSIFVEKSDILLIFNSASTNYLDQDVLSKINPRYFIYSKSSKDEKENINFAKTLNKNLFNIKEGNVRIIFEDKKIKITQ